jgi:GT2 family glycosyltransferase
MKRISIVIVNWNTRDLLLQCLASLRTCNLLGDCEVIVVDNGSKDDSVAAARAQFPEVNLIESGENLGFARGNNLGFEHANGRYVVLLNSDTIVLPGAVEALADYLDAHPKVGAVGGAQLDADGNLAPNGGWFPGLKHDLFIAFGLLWLEQHGVPLRPNLFRTRECDWVAGSFVCVRREVIEQTGGLPPEFFMYGEDIEWCWRIRDAGWQIAFVAGKPIIHLEGQSARKLYRTDKAIRILDSAIVFALNHRPELTWRLSTLALAGHWYGTALLQKARAYYRGSPTDGVTEQTLAYARRYFEHFRNAGAALRDLPAVRQGRGRLS